MSHLKELLSSEAPDMPTIESHLDGLDETARIDEIRSLGGREQARLFDAASGHRHITLDHLVDSSTPALHAVPHHGKNSLPMFSYFAKVFCLPDDEQAAKNERWGYNRSGGFLQTVVGPGYFVARPYDVDGELLVDYLRIPPRKPDDWPPILPNSARMSRFVYYGTQDVLRGVSRHVTIGRATKDGKNMDNWFVLCREG